MRLSTLQTLGLGTVIDIFEKGRLPVEAGELVDNIFGPEGKRGALVVSGANGIVGAGKIMQLGSRLRPFDVPVVALDFPGSADGIGQQYPGLTRAFGREGAVKVMENVVRMHYGGKDLPDRLKLYNPRFLLEAIPEILDIKKEHYKIFRDAFPGIEIRSVTSGFPSSQLDVGIAHPAFPHEINKVYETVEPEPSDITRLMWALGLIPAPVGDHWSFVLDVLFCGLTSIAVNYHRATNMPYWKIDKYIRKLLGPNPFRAHDVIGAAGANFLTWSCLHHLSAHYGELFQPAPELTERKDTGQNWYPQDHFRPVVNWLLDTEEEQQEFRVRVLGPYFQMVGLMLHEQRSHLSHINIMGELCAQFRNGPLAQIRGMGVDETIKLVDDYHRLQPEAAGTSWHPEVFEAVDGPAWQQLYVNAEHNGQVGVVTIGRESYNGDVDAEMNRALDWLKAAGINRVILSGDFHLTTQLVGADTGDFFPALEDESKGFAISRNWSRTARRFYREFEVSVGFINGKRCLGGMLELMMHCHYLVSAGDADLGMPEVTLPVVPGMEGCHWPLRKMKAADFPKMMHMLLEGSFVKAKEAAGWLVDYAGSVEESIKVSWKIVTGSVSDHGLPLRKVEEGTVTGLPGAAEGLTEADAGLEAAREAIFKTVQAACGVDLKEALDVQAKHCAGFMAGAFCKKGRIGAEFTKTMKV
jgi:enoyl-CoA hydratase/carnithine racemase/3-hydroxyacyl-CoA dehydrogenase